MNGVAQRQFQQALPRRKPQNRRLPWRVEIDSNDPVRTQKCEAKPQQTSDASRQVHGLLLLEIIGEVFRRGTREEIPAIRRESNLREIRMAFAERYQQIENPIVINLNKIVLLYDRLPGGNVDQR